MKKLVLLAVAAVAMSLGAASADPVSTPIGTFTVNEGGYVLSADGDASNPDPLDGYVYVTQDNICADSEGSPDDEDADPTCAN